MKPKYEQAQKTMEQLNQEYAGQYTPWGKLFPYPDYPEPTALPPDSPVIDLQAAVPVKVLLKAQVPSLVRLRGRPELRFSRAVLTVTTQTLKRNLALPQWGTTVTAVPADSEEYTSAIQYLLPGAQRISALGYKPQAEIVYQIREGGQFRNVTPVARSYAAIKPTYTVIDQAVETDAVQVKYNTDPADLVLLSESAPMRVMLAAGDDSPLQSFPSAVPAGQSVVSRDLGADLNRAWAAAKPVGGGLVEIPLKITSLTDGLVELKLEGAWQRQLVQPTAELQIDPFVAKTLQIPWLPGATAGTVSVQVEGESATGLRWGLAEQAGAGRLFAVRVTENLAIAQAVLLRGGGGTGPARSLTAVWLALPAVPPEPQTVELKLLAPAGDPVAPADGAPLARAEATLPSDTAAYVATGGGGPVWYRVPFPKPVALDGTASGQPLFLVCAGREGTLLLHRSLNAAARLPAAPGPGSAMVRNLAWASDWEDQAFDRHPARWVFDVELAPLPAEPLLTVNGQPLLLADGQAVFTAAVSVQPGTAAIALPLAARTAGKLKLTVAAGAPA